MKLIVGLGNPGKEYNNTRHNIGFQFIDGYLENKSVTDSWSNKFNGLYLQTFLNGEKVIFLKPQSYMNLSGGVVKRYVDYFNIDLDDILVVSDDLDLSIGNFKLRAKGSSGGHNGLKDIERMSEDGTFDVLPKKEVIQLKKEWEKLEKNLGGIKDMKKIPDAIFVVDPKKERICVQEAHSLGITLIGIADTNCDPEELDYVIPGNDDAIRAVKLIVSKMADAVVEANQGMTGDDEAYYEEAAEETEAVEE